MVILVTGGCGFIGGAFVRYVLKNTDAKVINVDLLTYAGTSPTEYPEYKVRHSFYQLDIGSNEIGDLLEAHRPDYIINFAAETHVDNSIKNPFRFVKTNVLQTYNLICKIQEYFEKYQTVRFLHVSTDEVYGELTSSEGSFSESSSYAPNSPYSATKESSDHLVRAFHRTYGLPAIITNCSNNYGPYQHPEKLIPTIIRNAEKNNKIPIYGSGMNVRDWLYVDDHCDALFQVLTKGTVGDRYNIGGKCESTNLNVAQTILSIMGKSSDLIEFVADRKGHDFRYAIDTTHIEQQLNWQTKHTFEDGLKHTVDWYLNNKEWVEKCVSLV